MGNAEHDGFGRAWMKGIEEAVRRLAWPARLPEDRVSAVAQEVAVAVWERSHRSADPPIRRSADP